MNDIQDAIHDRMTHNNLLPGMQLKVGNRLSVPTDVAHEESLRAHAAFELNAAVQGVLAAFGMTMHPILVLRVSTRFMRLC